MLGLGLHFLKESGSESESDPRRVNILDLISSDDNFVNDKSSHLCFFHGSGDCWDDHELLVVATEISLPIPEGSKSYLIET